MIHPRGMGSFMGPGTTPASSQGSGSAGIIPSPTSGMAEADSLPSTSGMGGKRKRVGSTSAMSKRSGMSKTPPMDGGGDDRPVKSMAKRMPPKRY